MPLDRRSPAKLRLGLLACRGRLYHQGSSLLPYRYLRRPIDRLYTLHEESIMYLLRQA